MDETIDILELDQSFAFRFGTEENSVSAETLSNFIIEFTSALTEINNTTNPGLNVEYFVGKTADGSLWLSVSAKFESKKNLFSKVVFNLVISLSAAFIYDKISNDEVTIIVNDSHYVVERDGETIILPHNNQISEQAVKIPPKAQKKISRAFSHLQNDERISDFQIYDKIYGSRKLLGLKREDFEVLTNLSVPDIHERVILREMQLIIYRPVMFESSTHWTFIFDGRRLNAKIEDPSFYLSVATGDRPITAGDRIDCSVEITQVKESLTGVWLDKNYSIIRVNNYISRQP